MTSRDRMIRAICAEPAIFDGRETALRSATSRVKRLGRIEIEPGHGFMLETPDGYGDREVWAAWDRVRETANLRAVATDGRNVIIYS